MKMKRIFAVCLLAASVFCGAEEDNSKFTPPQNSVPGKICVLIADVGTIDTVAKTEEFLTQIKQFNVDDTPRLSDADKVADPNLAKIEVTYRFNDSVRKYSDREREIAARNLRMERVLEQLRNSIVGNDKKRSIVVAKNYLQSFLQPYSSCIQVIDRANTSLSEVEKAIGGNSQQDVASACVFLTVIMQDLKESSQTVQVGNTMVKRTNYTQKAVANLRDFNGNVVNSWNAVARVSHRRTGASLEEGFNPADDLMEDVLKQIAEKLGDSLTASLKIRCRGPKGDKEFDEEGVTLTLNGNDFESGTRVLAGRYVLKAELDGYQTITRNLDLRPGASRTIKLKFVPASKAAAADEE